MLNAVLLASDTEDFGWLDRAVQQPRSLVLDDLMKPQIRHLMALWAIREDLVKVDPGGLQDFNAALIYCKMLLAERSH